MLAPTIISPERLIIDVLKSSRNSYSFDVSDAAAATLGAAFVPAADPPHACKILCIECCASDVSVFPLTRCRLGRYRQRKRHSSPPLNA